MKGNSKRYGISKERELKKILEKSGALFVTRQRGSFGFADITAFFFDNLYLISVKATRGKYFNEGAEIKLLEGITLPLYCRCLLAIYYCPHTKKKGLKGWIINDMKGNRLPIKDYKFQG